MTSGSRREVIPVLDQLGQADHGDRLAAGGGPVDLADQPFRVSDDDACSRCVVCVLFHCGFRVSGCLQGSGDQSVRGVGRAGDGNRALSMQVGVDEMMNPGHIEAVGAGFRGGDQHSARTAARS